MLLGFLWAIGKCQHSGLSIVKIIPKINFAILLYCCDVLTLFNTKKFNNFHPDPVCNNVFTGKVGHYTSWLVSKSSYSSALSNLVVHNKSWILDLSKSKLLVNPEQCNPWQNTAKLLEKNFFFNQSDNCHCQYIFMNCLFTAQMGASAGGSGGEVAVITMV